MSSHPIVISLKLCDLLEQRHKQMLRAHPSRVLLLDGVTSITAWEDQISQWTHIFVRLSSTVSL